VAAAATVTGTVVADAAVPATAALAQPAAPSTGIEDDARKPRKRRRRRHGRPLEGEAGTTPNAPLPAGDKTAPAPAAGGDKPSLFSRIGRRIKSLVGG
jgi:ATP-dependent RNA helicase RhlB